MMSRVSLPMSSELEGDTRRLPRSSTAHPFERRCVRERPLLVASGTRLAHVLLGGLAESPTGRSRLMSLVPRPTCPVVDAGPHRWCCPSSDASMSLIRL